MFTIFFNIFVKNFKQKVVTVEHKINHIDKKAILLLFMNCKQKRKKNDKSFIIAKSMTKDI